MEDLVSFEIAKKLKEKEFDEECYTFYEYDSKEFYREERIPCCNSRSDDYTAPTLSQVLKWLREEKKIAINVEFIPHVWQYKILDMSFENKFEPCGKTFYAKYEEAALAGIKYILDNLI